MYKSQHGSASYQRAHVGGVNESTSFIHSLSINLSVSFRSSLTIATNHFENFMVLRITDAITIERTETCIMPQNRVFYEINYLPIAPNPSAETIGPSFPSCW